MISETYLALASCARRRIGGEWPLTSAEVDILTLLLELSYDLGQTWACIPRLEDVGIVLGLHKSTISRALRRLRKNGHVQVLMRREETLYAICTTTPGRASAAPDPDRAQRTRRKLVEINKNRLGGQADPDGQQRLPGVLPNEELEAPAAAFEALMEEPQAEGREQRAESSANREPRTGNREPSEKVEADGEESDEAFYRRLENHVNTYTITPPVDAAGKLLRLFGREEGDPVAIEPTPSRSPAAGPSTPQDLEMAKLCRGLRGDPLNALQRVREECASAGRIQEATFFKWGRAWRKRCEKYPLQILEVAGEHKSRRHQTGGAKEPGAWMYRAFEDLLNCVAKN